MGENKINGETRGDREQKGQPQQKKGEAQQMPEQPLQFKRKQSDRTRSHSEMRGFHSERQQQDISSKEMSQQSNEYVYDNVIVYQKKKKCV